MTTTNLHLEADALELRALLEEAETLVGALTGDTTPALEKLAEAFALAGRLADALADRQEGTARDAEGTE